MTQETYKCINKPNPYFKTGKIYNEFDIRYIYPKDDYFMSLNEYRIYKVYKLLKRI